MINIRKY